ncbi:tetratricopeptide repeat-containing sensor histidine kinase [Chryseobacterium contaminans]|uniref:tetratricopeptide repeat-containing sensor histidine kinase n=1 Tax=Chryseobacterium contaminans TaxID=1423959 RepID=UPI003016CFD9
MMKYLFFSLLILVSCRQEKADTNTINEGNDNLYKEGVALVQNDNVKAYSKFQQAIIHYNKLKDSVKISKSLIYQSIVQNYTGDYLGAEATLVEALNYMKEGDESYYSVYGSLGNLKYDQKEYSEAEKWYTKALAEEIKSPDEKVNLINNKSASEYRQGKYSKALKTLKQIDLTKISDQNLINRIKENTVYTQWLQNNNYPAQKEFEKLLKEKLQNNDLWGANSSYAHLAEINQKTAPEASLIYAKKMLKNAIKIKSPEDRLEAMEKIISVDTSSNSKQNFKTYKALSDSIQRSRNDYRNRFAYIKYDSEKKNAENQTLKTQNAESKIKLLQQNIILSALSLLLIGGIFWYKRRKKRLQQEKELEVKNTQLKMSKKVHDVVANGIYQVMTKIENQKDFDKDKALDELEFVYEKSRDISYEKEDIKDTIEFAEKIFTLIDSFKSDHVKPFLTGNSQNIWDGVNETTQNEVFQVIRELLINMKKHSQASLVTFKFEKNHNLIHIQYKDNGIGIPGEIIKGNGLTNTVSRIEKIKGTIIFDNTTETGLKINISFPTS